MMITWDEWTQRKRAAADLAARSGRLGVVLSLVSSLAIVAIASKNQFVGSLWIYVAAFAMPMPIALHFKNQILRLGVATYLAAIVFLLGAAVLFGT